MVIFILEWSYLEIRRPLHSVFFFFSYTFLLYIWHKIEPYVTVVVNEMKLTLFWLELFLMKCLRNELYLLLKQILSVSIKTKINEKRMFHYLSNQLPQNILLSVHKKQWDLDYSQEASS